jgi:S-methylmethionine-dependent homocysteine/selenocysteine methylase
MSVGRDAAMSVGQAAAMSAGRVTVLDGGMGRQLERSGAPFRQPEWSALALMQAPDTVLAAHRAFIAAGAEVITTNSYALVPFHIGEARFAADGARLAALAGRLARQAAAEAPHPVRVAGSLPPLFGSYRPDLFDPARAPAMLDALATALLPHVDLFLAETMSSIEEALAACAAVRGAGKPVWVSYTLAEPLAGSLAQPSAGSGGPPCLRSGQPVTDAVAAAAGAGAGAILFNCSPPEVMGAAVDAARAVLGPGGGPDGVPIGVYANAFPHDNGTAAANEGISALRDDLTPARYQAWAADWRRRGASLIGGCCGIGPEHICALTPAQFKPDGAPP